MTKAVYIWRVLVETLDHFIRVIKGIRKAPFFDTVDGCTACLDGSLLSEKIERFFQILGVNIRGSLDDSIGTIFELHQSNAQILSFDIIMVQSIGHSHNRVYFVPHHPTEEVNIMDALVHKSAAVLFPCSTPLCS